MKVLEKGQRISFETNNISITFYIEENIKLSIVSLFKQKVINIFPEVENIKGLKQINNHKYTLDLTKLENSFDELLFISHCNEDLKGYSKCKISTDKEDFYFTSDINEGKTCIIFKIYKYNNMWKVNNRNDIFYYNFYLFLDSYYDYQIKNKTILTKVKTGIKNTKETFISVSTAFLTIPELLKWSESITKSPICNKSLQLWVRFCYVHITKKSQYILKFSKTNKKVGI